MNILDFFILISSTVLPSSKNLGSTTPTTENYTLQKCLPITITICEGYSNTIQCPVNSLIEIQSAIYGRNSRSICPSSYNQKSATQLNNCTFSKNVTSIVQKWCNNYNSCLIQSNNGQFNDPCGGIYKYTVVTYSCLLQGAWSQWSDWASCNVSYGFINRTRECNASIDATRCCGNNFEVKPCFVFWTEWSIWTSCNDSELISRSRQCNNSDSDFSCDGFANEEKKCSESSCEITFSAGLNESNIIEFCSGNNSECFAKWAVWSEFSTSCGVGYRRSYLISETKISSVFRDQSCDLGNCPVDGMWGTWSDSKCVNSCSSEVKTYERNCDKPYPLFYGRDCIGLSAYINSCEDNTICPVNGKWSLWSSWSACSQPCNGGVKSRFRSCSNPTPKYGGLNCNGKNKKIHKCNLQKCQSRDVNLAIDFLDEDFINSYIMLSDGRSNLKDRIIQAITKLYSDRRVNASFSIVLHSIKEQP